jgi:hypothetical protein
MAKDDDNKQPVNPAEEILGAIPSGERDLTFRTGIPANYRPPSGQLPKPVFDEKTGQEITRTYYDLTNDPGVILNALKPETRTQILNGLAQKITGYKPGTGFDDKDRSAFSDLLYFANITGKSFAEAYNEFMRTVPNVQKVTKAPTIRVSSEDDVKAVFRRTTRDLLGRDLGDAEAAKFAKMYRNLEIGEAQRMQAGGVVEQAPDASVLAEKRVEKQFGVEAQAYRAMQFMNIMDDSIRRLGA